jgi:steroid delta-isomerase-like uncharacterized protein
MTESLERNRQTVRRLFAEAFNRRDDAVADELVAASYGHREAAGPQTIGPDNIKQTVRWLAAAFPDFEQELVDVVADGDRVWATTVLRGTHEGPFLGYPPSGRRIAAKQVHMFRLDGRGRVYEHRAVRDDLSVLASIGGLELTDQARASLTTPQPVTV